MSNRLEGKVLVAQGGGPTPVINQSVVGVALEARKFSQVTSIYGAVHGVRGIVEENFVDLTRETTHNLEQVADTPSSGLLSTRDKPDEEYCARMFKVMQAHDIRYFFYVGGNDSSDTVRIVNEQAKAANYELRAIHIPKTIDNDLMENDHCPGFGSAARFVAQAFIRGEPRQPRAQGRLHRCRDGPPRRLPHRRVRRWRRNMSMTARTSFTCRSAPSITEKFLADVDRVYQKHGLCTIAVSEGISDADGTRDDHQADGRRGARRPRQRPAFRHRRARRPAFQRRSARASASSACVPTPSAICNAPSWACRSDRDAHEAREVGEKAVQFAMWDNVDGSVAIRRPVLDYSVDYELVPHRERGRQDPPHAGQFHQRGRQRRDRGFP